MPSDKELRVETEIEGSPEEVYRAITDPSEFKVWDPYRTVSDIRPGGAMTWRFQGNEGGVNLVQVEPRRRLSGDFIPEPGRKSRSDVELTPTARGVRVTLILRDLPTDPRGVEIYSAAQEGWGGWVENLKAHVEVAKGRVLTKVVEDLRVATHTIEGNDVEHLFSRLGETGPKVIEKVRSGRAAAVGTVLVYHGREPWKVEVGCVLEGDLEPELELQVRKLAGGLVVARPYLRYSYEYAWFLQNGMERWCGLNGYRPIGPVREIYAGNIWGQKEPVPGEVQVPVTREKAS